MNFIKRLCAVFCTIFIAAGIFFTVYGTVNKGESFTFAYNIGTVNTRGININLKTHKIKSVTMPISSLQFETPPETSRSNEQTDSATGEFTADGVVFNGETVTALSFDFDTLAVKIISGDELKIESADNKINYSIDNGVLHIDADLSSADSQLTVTLPKGAAFEWVEVKTDMGSFKSEAEIITKKLTVINDTGAVEMRNITVTEKLDAQNELGSIELYGAMQNEIKLTNDLGNISCEITGDENNYGYKINTSLGRIKIGSAKAVKNGTASADTDKQSIITAECDLGNITVTFKK